MSIDKEPHSPGSLDYHDYPILVVDDDMGNLMAFRLNFDETFHIVTARSGMEGLSKIRKESITVAIVDQKMPQMTGIEFLEIVKKEKPQVVRILITAYTDTDILIDAINRGSIYYFIPKPWRQEELEVIIKRSIDMYILSAQNRELLERLKRHAGEMDLMIQKRTSELRDANEKLKKLAVTDGLTALYNQIHFKRKLVEEVKRAKRFGHPLSLLMLDIDYFKNYNDKMGHLSGDQILKQFAVLLKRELREVDFIARYGGEEFAVILPETPKDSALFTGEKLRTSLERADFPHKEIQPQKVITTSIGVSSYPEDGTDAAILIESADRALLRAKRIGRNKVISYQKEIDGEIEAGTITIEEDYPDILI